ncbi:MAG TPA: 4'-phosphopantetheinyl transferase superfamily protein [Gaiellaceae bacterium]|jgi:4'-phosphopantetheinyl transferase|nr:4'-phosphopantetheinyl transferase superfamily protein [Gaiellaceae bacterium]
MISLWIFADVPIDSDGALERVLRPLAHERDSHGRPFVPGHPELRLSMSHAEGMLLVAVADGCRVGVDVEIVRDRGISSLPAHALSERELNDLGEPPGLETFLSYWTRKEAVLKAAGVGLAIEPSLVELARNGPNVCRLPAAFGPPDRWSACEVPLDGYAAAFAADVPSPVLSVHRASAWGFVCVS